MEYYELFWADSKNDVILINDYDLKGFDLTRLWKGERIEDWNEDIMLYYEKDGLVWDYVPNVLTWLIFSDRLVDLLYELGITDIQVFPVTLHKKGSTKKLPGYNVVNILTSVSAFNWERSDYVPWEDDPKSIKVIRKLVMNRSSLEGSPDMFRLAEDKHYIITSDRLKKAVEERGITGIKFRPAELV